MAWNADTTRMPYRMHTEYLQRLYLDNALAAGRFMVVGRPAAIQNNGYPEELGEFLQEVLRRKRDLRMGRLRRR